ncbi:hypothetical protein GEMRC1_008865 [Eukaryota sp. GEM-RC1]
MKTYSDLFQPKDISLEILKEDFVGQIWENRSPYPLTKIYRRDEKYAGKTCSEKVELLRSTLLDLNCFGILVTELPEIAWTLNLDASDIPFSCCPSYCYLIVTDREIKLYVLENRPFGSKVLKMFEENEVQVLNYFDICKSLEEMNLEKTADLKFLIPSSAPAVFRKFNFLPSVKIDTSPIIDMKVVKNPIEQEQQASASIKDSVALCEVFYWVKNIACHQSNLIEEDIADYLVEKDSNNSTLFHLHLNR